MKVSKALSSVSRRDLFKLTGQFGMSSVLLGAGTSGIGAYASYFLDVSPGGLIVSLQTALFLLAFLFAPKHGLVSQKRAIRAERVTI